MIRNEYTITVKRSSGACTFVMPSKTCCRRLSVRARFTVRAYVLLFGAVLWTVPRVAAQHAIEAETWVEMRKAMREQGPAPTIQQDVGALAGNRARQAGPRLIERGPEVLPAVHGALLSPGVEPRHAVALLQVMGAIAEKSSVPVLLEFVRSEAGRPLRRDALYVLALLPATDDAAALASGIAADETEAWNTRRMAYTWFGLHRDRRGHPFATALRTDPDPARRAAGLYVLARLGDETALEPIAEMLAGAAPAGTRDALLLALAELEHPSEFERRVPQSLSQSAIYRDALRYARYRTAAPGERPAICLEMLHSQAPGHLGIAVRCLLGAGRAHALRPYAALNLEVPGRTALVRNEIRRAGWYVVDTDAEFRIEPGANATVRP